MARVKEIKQNLGNLDAILYKSCRKSSFILKIVLLEEIQRMWMLMAGSLKLKCDKYDYVNQLNDLVEDIKYDNEKLVAKKLESIPRSKDNTVNMAIKEFLQNKKNFLFIELNDRMYNRLEELAKLNIMRIVDQQSLHIASTFRKYNRSLIKQMETIEKEVNEDDMTKLGNKAVFKPFLPLMNINFKTNMSLFNELKNDWKVLLSTARLYQRVLIIPPNDASEFSKTITNYFKNLSKSKEFAKCTMLRSMITKYTARLSKNYNKYFEDSVNEGNTNNIITKFIDDLVANVNDGPGSSEMDKRRIYSELEILNRLYRSQKNVATDEVASSLLDTIDSLIGSSESDENPNIDLTINGKTYSSE